MTKSSKPSKPKAATAFRRGRSTSGSHAVCSKRRRALKARISLLEARVENLEVVLGKTLSLGVDVAQEGRRNP